MPHLKTETFGGGDTSWLGSTHGIGNARTVTVNYSTLTANTHFPNGFIPSGTPFAIVSGLAVPYDVTAGTTTGAGIIAGFCLFDVAVSGTANFPIALLDHGRVKVSKVPYASFAAPLAAKNATTIVYQA